MNVLAAVIVYDRFQTIDLWLRAYNNSYKYPNTRLLVVNNCDPDGPSKLLKQTIDMHKPDHYWRRDNIGQDIGAFRDLIRNREYDPYDILFWCVDDNIPMRRDFLYHFIQPFIDDPQLGLVGNHFVKGSFYPNYKFGVPDHIRTTCFAIRREVAHKLFFPIKLVSKWDCYCFEWADKSMNLTQQVKRMGYKFMPVCKDFSKCWVDCSELVYDAGDLNKRNPDKRCQKDCWDDYERQFQQ